MTVLRHIERKTLPYTPEQMFDLVARVDLYKEFAPWCIGSRIKQWEGNDVFYGELIVGYKLIREKFISKVHLEEHDHIYIEYLQGPLKHLKNHWRFIPECNGHCTIDFSVEFEFKNSMLQKIAEVFFNEVIRRMVGAFEKRADSVYGRSSIKSDQK